MRNRLARASLAVLTAAASMAAFTTSASAAPEDVLGFELVFETVGDPTGQINADHLILDGAGNTNFALIGQDFTPGSEQEIRLHKGTCEVPGPIVDIYELDVNLRESPSDSNPRATTTADANIEGTPGSFRYNPTATPQTAIPSDDIPTFADDYVVVIDEVGTDDTDYFCGTPGPGEVVNSGGQLGTPFPIFFKELNSSGFSATGTATLIGNRLFLEINYSGLDTIPPAHFQVLRQSASCPTGATATEAQIGGSVQFALTQGIRSLLPGDALTGESFFVHVAAAQDGTLHYEASLPLTFTQRQNLASSIIVLHGFDVNGNGTSDGGPSPLGSGLKAEETAVAGCGQLAPLPPGAPTGVEATANGSTVNVSWTAPASNGGAPITGYTVTVDGVTKTVTGTTASFSDVGAGVQTVTVVANNSAGASPPATGSVEVPSGPGVPSALSTRSVGSKVFVSWKAPTDDGGDTITGYTVTLGTGDTITVTGTRTEFTDVAAGTHSVTVVANNGAGGSDPLTGSVIVRDCQDGDVDDDWDSIVVTPQDGSLFRLYCGYFLRYPDEPGFVYWQGVQGGGADLILISDQFALSQEFQNTYGTLNNDQFVRLLYKNVLLRPVDDEGYAYWKGFLDSGELSQGGTMRWVAEGVEFQRVTGTP